MAVTTTSVSTNAEANLGTTLEVASTSRGPQTWVYVLNEDSNALAAGDVVMRNTTSTDYKVVLSSAGALVQSIRCVGVAQHAIPAGSYGYVLRRGLGTIQVGSGATVSDSEGLTPGGVEAGSIIKFAAGNVAPGCIMALAVQNIAANATGLAFIDCRG
jgi:hypothetical protein